MKNIKVTAVIPSLYNHDGEYLKLCVESLRATTNWDIIVVTNGSSNKPDLKHIKGITKHIHTTGQGQCVAVNYGAQLVSSDTDYIFVSNSDMYYAPGWNKYISTPDDWDRLRKHGYDAVFSPNLVEPTDNNGSALPFLKFDGGLTIDNFKQKEVDGFIEETINQGKDDPSTYTYTYEPGFNLPFFINKDFWNFLGGYDIKYDPWGSNSDTDLQTRINLAGVTPMRLRDVLVYHFSNKTPTFAPENQEYYQRNFKIFYDKFGFDRDELGSDVWYNKDMIPTDESKIKYRQDKWTSENTTN